MLQKILRQYSIVPILSGIIFWLILTPTSNFRILSTMFIPFAASLLLAKYRKALKMPLSGKALNFLISLIAGVIFGWNELRNGKPVMLIMLLSAASVMTGYCFLSKFSQALSNAYNERKESVDDAAAGKKIYFFLFALAACLMAICTKSSPLYPFNDWEDANCFFTMGKCIMNGMVMYRDIYEHKGPLLYMLHGAAYLISQDTFLGVYFIEVLSCFVFLCICYHTARLFTKRYAVHSVCITALFTYSSVSFCSGDSAEELCLPFLAYAFYIGLKSLRHGKTVDIRGGVYTYRNYISMCLLDKIHNGGVLHRMVFDSGIFVYKKRGLEAAG